MGLQSRTPSTSALSAMACLDVETPSICRGKFKSALKAPTAFHERIRSLERARTGSFLKHKLCSRPERSELVRMHILQETRAEPSLQARQMKLKRARLADNLNGKISQRPGPLELVEKNILPVSVPSGDKAESLKPADVYIFSEDSSEALSPPQPANQQSASSTSSSSSSSTSPRETGENDATSASSRISPSAQRSPSPSSPSASDSVSLVFAAERPSSRKAPSPPQTAAASPCGSVLVKQSLSRLPGDRSRSKRSKEPKPRVKKLKYHQYIPPDRKQELSEVPMDSAYARLLQQQQQFLQLQILRQQHFGFQPSPAATLNGPTAEAQTSCSGLVLAAPSHVQPQPSQANCKPDHLPANLDEMKVAELKMELKLRSLPVSGTKTDLIERLRLYQETSNLQTAAAAAAVEKAVIPEAPQPENAKLSPPVSPIVSRVSGLGIEDRGLAEGPAKLPDASSVGSAVEESPAEKGPLERDSERDKRLHEKERQIEELMRKLEQEQRLVEELKMQLEVEKRSLNQGDSPAHFSPLRVKDESAGPSSCPGACGSPGVPALIKQEQAEAPRAQFALSQQTAEQPAEAGAHVLLAVPFPPAAGAVQLPAGSLVAHGPDSGAGRGLLPSPAQLPPKTEASPQRRGSRPHAWRADGAATAFLNSFPAGGRPAGASLCQAGSEDPATVVKSDHSSQAAFTQQPKFQSHVSKSKEPPCYEDAVKQTRTLQSAVQGPTAASQQMDDLFDVLIKSGEISPFRQDATCQERPLPVTASVTTLPINTALSRPPPLVQVARLPAASLGAGPGLADLSSQSLLGGTLARSGSPEVAMEMGFNESSLPSSLNLHGAGMDNMDWLDLNLSAEGVGPLDMAAPVGVFQDLLDSQELQLNWD